MRTRQAIRAERVFWRRQIETLREGARFNLRLARQCVSDTRTLLAILKIIHGGKPRREADR